MRRSTSATSMRHRCWPKLSAPSQEEVRHSLSRGGRDLGARRRTHTPGLSSVLDRVQSSYQPIRASNDSSMSIDSHRLEVTSRSAVSAKDLVLAEGLRASGRGHDVGRSPLDGVWRGAGFFCSMGSCRRRAPARAGVCSGTRGAFVNPTSAVVSEVSGSGCEGMSAPRVCSGSLSHVIAGTAGVNFPAMVPERTRSRALAMSLTGGGVTTTATLSSRCSSGRCGSDRSSTIGREGGARPVEGQQPVGVGGTTWLEQQGVEVGGAAVHDRPGARRSRIRTGAGRAPSGSGC